VTFRNAHETLSARAKSGNVFGQARKAAKRLRGGRRGWTIALQVREVNSGAVRREARERVREAARRREIDVMLVWRLDRWGRSVTDLVATLQELEHRRILGATS